MTTQPIASTLVFAGTYTQTMGDVQGTARGIPVYRLEPSTGSLTAVSTAAGVTNPSYLALDPRRRFLYAVNELDEGGVSAFSVDPAMGALTFLNRQASHGGAPAYVSVDHEGHWAMVANYESGSVAVLPIREDGSLGPASDVVQHEGHSVNPERQQGPHAHCIMPDPDNHFVLVADLGLDKIMIYRLDTAHGKLIPNDPPWTEMQPGSGPRHIAFHPNGRYAYVINELDSTLTACTYDAAHGLLHPVQRVSTLPGNFTGENSGAAVRVAPSGRFVYGSNRGHDSIVVFAIDAATGMLTYVDHTSTEGRTPRDFNIDPSGTFLLAANQDSDTIVTFRVDQQTGKLSTAGQVAEVMTPVCVTFSG
jgi:6-phosphogluconolactonase